MQYTDRSEVPIWRRIASGALLAAAGMAMLAISWSYPAGSLTQMGPGYMPHAIAVVLILMGLGIVFSDMCDTAIDQDPAFHWRAFLFISAAILAFVMLIEPAGLIPAMFCAVAISMLANRSTHPISILIYSAAVTFAGWLIFLVALGLPLSAFGR